MQIAPAQAWCNGYFEGTITNDVSERAVPFVSGSYSTNVFVRTVRPPSRRVMGGSVSFPTLPPLPPVVVIGTPGVTYDYLENLQALALSGRRVLMLGTCEAPSDRPWWPAPEEVGPRAMRRPRVAAQQVLVACRPVLSGSPPPHSGSPPPHSGSRRSRCWRRARRS